MRRAWTVAVGAAVLGMVTLGAVATGSSPSAGAQLRCNGRVRLCGLSLGEVAFATTHNSMSSPADGFIGPNQGKPMSWQLAHHIRGFQIDAYEGVDRGGRIYTELAGPFGTQATDLPPALVATATRIHESIGAPPAGTPTDVYLCHTFCELGGVKLSVIAAEVRAFLDDHPNDVLVFVVEDYVAPERIRAELAGAGLDRELVAVAPGAELPTLGEMIAARTRLLVSLENGDGGPTMPNAFTALVQETPFTFLTASSLRAASSCDPNRGVAGAPIFQFNHWVTPPTTRRARAVNERALRERVERCTAARGRTPTLVAVDFAERSAVVDVVDRINRASSR
ncbi:MAG TPA: hypothetical protein VFZ17_07195 [Acidimicrobiia bacterium]|nr:hypothetical protein [Acidimicrobiia bacterium]